MIHEAAEGMIIQELSNIHFGHESEPDKEKENKERAAADRLASRLHDIGKAGAFQSRYRQNIKTIEPIRQGGMQLRSCNPAALQDLENRRLINPRRQPSPDQQEYEQDQAAKQIIILKHFQNFRIAPRFRPVTEKCRRRFENLQRQRNQNDQSGEDHISAQPRPNQSP